MPPSKQLAIGTALATSLALCDQFALSLSPAAKHDPPTLSAGAPSPLVLLKAAATTLKAQVTKISLLAITTPFTPSAVVSSLQPVNESVLPSLVTATLLTTPEQFSASFSSECRLLTLAVLRDLQGLVRLVEARSKEKKLDADLSEVAKKPYTESTGRIWDGCDQLIDFATHGFSGYIVRKSKQWLELMKDAVKELQEWDPEEDVDDGDIFGEAGSDDEDGDNHDREDTTTNHSDRAAISAGVKDQALKVLNRIPQSVHVVIKQRLEKLGSDPSSTTQQNAILDAILSRSKNISELIDESAEGMYMGDLELCLKKAGEARAITIELVESVITPIDSAASRPEAGSQTNEDKYVKRALEWIRQVDPGVVK